jgi:acid phosphatase (class A)
MDVTALSPAPMPEVAGLPKPGSPGQRTLPPPPADGSLVHKAELKFMHAIEKTRTPERDAWAKRMDTGIAKEWWKLANDWRKDVGFVEGAKGMALLGAALTANVAVTMKEKEKYDRPRPYEADPSLNNLFVETTDSYPSGHASTSFAAARVMSHLDPQDTADYYKLASQIAASRVYAGVHYPSDVAAGAALGTGVAQVLIDKFGGQGDPPER